MTGTIERSFNIKRNSIPSDASELFKAIRRQFTLHPNPCYCIRRAISNIRFFSSILGLEPYYVAYKRSKSQKNKQLSLEYLEKIIYTLEEHFIWQKNRRLTTREFKKLQLIENNIKKIMDLYRISRDLKLYSRGGNGILKNHPNLKFDYFKDIYSKEKAYWLGWLFAEAYIRIHSYDTKGNPYYRLGVGCEASDLKILKKFAQAINFNLVKIKPTIEKYLTKDGEEHTFRRIRLINNEFCEHLISRGFIVGNEKSKNIRLPKFNNRDLLLAFLLGYYDGDGTMGRSRITSGSKKFLEDILKSPFLNLKNKIVSNENISLGANLMREMVKNYGNSLQRKRIYWENYIDARKSRFI